MRVEDDRLSGTVFIAEQEDPGDLFMLTGLFAGHLERDDDLADEFEDLSADEAIAWGRERARVVLIRAWPGQAVSRRCPRASDDA